MTDTILIIERTDIVHDFRRDDFAFQDGFGDAFRDGEVEVLKSFFGKLCIRKYRLALMMEIEITPIMAEADDIRVLQVLPSPVDPGEFAVTPVFLADIVTGVISDNPEILIVERLPDVNGQIWLLADLDVVFMTADDDMTFHT